MNSLQTTSKVINVLQSSPDYQLLIVPDEILQSYTEDNQQHFLLISKELIIDKFLIKVIFKECHSIIQPYLSKKNGEICENDQDLLFLASNGILMILNEHITVLNIHKDIFFHKLHNSNSNKDTIITKELNLLSSFLTCNNPKINKSSTLWTFFKQLYDHIKSNNIDFPNIDQFYLKTVLKSAKTHTNNYYAWLALKFLISRSDDYLLNLIQMEVWKYCKVNINESAAWNGLVSCFTINETLSDISKRLDQSLDKLLEVQEWIDKFKISTSFVPYDSLKGWILWCFYNAKYHKNTREYKERILIAMNFVFKKVCSLKDENTFELNEIQIKNGYYVDLNGVDIKSKLANMNLQNRETVLIYCHWLRLKVFYEKKKTKN